MFLAVMGDLCLELCGDSQHGGEGVEALMGDLSGDFADRTELGAADHQRLEALEACVVALERRAGDLELPNPLGQLAPLTLLSDEDAAQQGGALVDLHAQLTAQYLSFEGLFAQAGATLAKVLTHGREHPPDRAGAQ